MWGYERPVLYTQRAQRVHRKCAELGLDTARVHGKLLSYKSCHANSEASGRQCKQHGGSQPAFWQAVLQPGATPDAIEHRPRALRICMSE